MYLLSHLVRMTGIEPVRSPTRPSNVRVCQFRHIRISRKLTRGGAQQQELLYLGSPALSTRISQIFFPAGNIMARTQIPYKYDFIIR